MDNNIDLLLINSIAPRQHSISDLSLENSLVLIRQHLEDEGFKVLLRDYQKLQNIEKGVPKIIRVTLRALVRWQTYTLKKSKLIFSALFLIAIPLQNWSISFKNRYLDDLINEITEEIKSKKISIVGIKAWYGASYKWCERLAISIRKHTPETLIIVGGPQVNIYSEYILEDGLFDLAISGPAEKALKDLIISYKNHNGKDSFINHILTKNNNSKLILCDSASFINHSSCLSLTIPNYKPQEMDGKLRYHTIVDGVGCPWSQCNFCCHPLIHNRYLPRDIDQIIEEIKLIRSKGIRFFRFSCSDTPLNQGYKIAQGILNNNIDIKFSMFSRASLNPNRDFLAYSTMINAGLRAVFMGGETGHDLINDVIMNKGLKKINIIESIKVIREAAESLGKKCYIVLSLIYPCPVVNGVSLNDVFNENIDLINKSNPDSVIVNPPSPYPNTKWFNNHNSYGFNYDSKFVQKLMRYEYTNFKPIETWDDLPLSLGAMSLKQILLETGKLRNYAGMHNIITDFTDDYFIIAEEMGLQSKEEFQKFKNNILVDIMSGTSVLTNKIHKAINTNMQEGGNYESF